MLIRMLVWLAELKRSPTMISVPMKKNLLMLSESQNPSNTGLKETLISDWTEGFLPSCQMLAEGFSTLVCVQTTCPFK